MKKMTLIDKAFLLKKTPLFNDLELDLLLPIADKLNTALFKADETIYTTNDSAHLLYFIASGTIAVNDHHLGTNHFFGDRELFNDLPRQNTAVSTSEDTVLLTLSKPHLLTIISECPSVALSFLRVYALDIQQKDA